MAACIIYGTDCFKEMLLKMRGFFATQVVLKGRQAYGYYSEWNPACEGHSQRRGTQGRARKANCSSTLRVSFPFWQSRVEGLSTLPKLCLMKEILSSYVSPLRLGT